MEIAGYKFSFSTLFFIGVSSVIFRTSADLFVKCNVNVVC